MKKKRKILFIAPLPPPVHGSAMMTQYIKDSKTLNDAVEQDWINLSTSRRMDEIGKKSPVKIFRFISSYFKTIAKLCTNRYDACYLAITCHGNGFLKDAPFALLCKMFGKKLIIHQHNKGMSRDVNRPFRRKLLNWVYRNSTVILLSERLYPDIQAIVDHSQTFICPNGIPELPEFSSISERHNAIPHLLFLSNLIPSKGVITLLDAMRILKERGIDVKCDFIGGESKDIDSNTFNTEVGRRGLENYVSYLGKKYGDEKTEELKRHDIFVFPTYYDNECFPLVLLEAMQAGMPCISTEEGAIPDLLDGTGLVVPPRNPDALADAIEKLIKDKILYAHLSQKAFTKFNSNYTLAQFEQNIVKCIKII